MLDVLKSEEQQDVQPINFFWFMCLLERCQSGWMGRSRKPSWGSFLRCSTLIFWILL